MNVRKEKDSLGSVSIPAGAYYGPQTKRAVDNFPISGITFQPEFIYALALIKKCAAEVNLELGLLDPEISAAIVEAANEVMAGKFEDQFVVDIFQTGSGTSTHMNMNEVLATRANEIITGEKALKSPVHPNDHVNLGQSSNDAVPTAIHMACMMSLKNRLLASLDRLCQALSAKSTEFKDIIKIGRTHLQDAVPLTLGQEFSGYARQIELGIKRLTGTEERLAELALGGTAVGSGLNTHPEFARKVIALISRHTNVSFKEAQNHFEAQAARDAAVETSGALKTVATSLVKIANDIRWLASGPRCGIGEINIPALQPGSSIMPGKVNPVIPEAIIQVSAHVTGNDLTITLGGQAGIFELNVMLPVIAYNLLQSIALLASSVDVFVEKCINGITANHDRCAASIEKSLAMVTGLVPHIGYDRAASLAQKAYNTGKTIREIVLEDKTLPKDLVDKLLNPAVR